MNFQLIKVHGSNAFEQTASTNRNRILLKYVYKAITEANAKEGDNGDPV